MDFIDVCAFMFFLGFFVFIGLYKSPTPKTDEAYLFSRRNTSYLSLTACLVMSELNTATLLAFSSLGYLSGRSALKLPLIFLFGLLFYAVSVAKKWKSFNGSSVASLFTKTYGSSLGKLTSICLILATVGFSSVYVRSLCLIFTPIFPSISSFWLSIFFVSLSFLSAFRGGLVSIIRTDFLSGFFAMLFFPLIAYLTWQVDAKASFEPIHQVGDDFVFSLILLTMFTYILAPWYGQKIFCAKSPKTAYWSVISASFIVPFLYGCAIFSTICFRERGFISSSIETAFPELIKQILPSGLRGLGFALLFMLSATTLSSIWSALTSMWVSDFLSKKIEHSRKIQGVLVSFCFAVISLILANVFVDAIFDKLILANIPIAALSFALFSAFYSKNPSKNAAYISIFIGLFAAIYSYLLFGENYTWYWTVWGIPLSFIGGGCVSFFETRLLPLKDAPF